jgi:hypothetical protein
MRYCPLDKIDYDDDVEECIICGGPLVDGTSREQFDDADDDRWVELDPVNSLTHAKMVMEALEEEDIDSYTEAFYGGGGDDGYTATVMVQEDRFDNALEIQQGLTPPDEDDLIIDPDSDDF